MSKFLRVCSHSSFYPFLHLYSLFFLKPRLHWQSLLEKLSGLSCFNYTPRAVFDVTPTNLCALGWSNKKMILLILLHHSRKPRQVLHSHINSLKSGLLYMTSQPYCREGRSAKVKDGIINLILRNYLIDWSSDIIEFSSNLFAPLYHWGLFQQTSTMKLHSWDFCQQFCKKLINVHEPNHRCL